MDHDNFGIFLMEVKYLVRCEPDAKERISILEETSMFDNLLDEARKATGISELNVILYDNCYVSNDEVIIDYRDDNSMFIIDIDAPKHQEEIEFNIFTSESIDSMYKGRIIILPLSTTPDQLKSMLFERNDENIFVHLYLFGGIKFCQGTLGEYIKMYNPIKYHIYVVLTRHYSDSQLQNQRDSINIEEPELFYHPTDSGLNKIGLFLEYIRRNGYMSDKIINALAIQTMFAPLLVSILNIKCRKKVIAEDVVIAVASLYTLFRSYLNDDILPRNVFDYTFEIGSYLMYKGSSIPAPFINIGDSLLWECDLSETRYRFPFYEPPQDLMNIYDSKHGLKPYSTFAIGRIQTPFLCNYEHKTYLCTEVKAENSFVEGMLYDLVFGYRVVKITNHYINYEYDYNNDFIINPAYVEQIIVYGSDNSQIAVNFANLEKEIYESYRNNIYKYRTFTIGSASFFNQLAVTFKRFAVFSPDDMNPLVKNASYGKCFLWDSIYDMAVSLVVFNTNKHDVPFPKAKNRLIITTQGKDEGSKTSLTKLIQELQDNEVIVDGIVVGDNKCDDFIRLCHSTGGCAFHIDSKIDADELFDHESFMKISLRPAPVFTSSINFDQECPNKLIIAAKAKTILKPASSASNSNVPTDRFRVIQRQLIIASENDDPNIEVYAVDDQIDQWRVFIKPDDGLNKWWYLFIEFGIDYPRKPPVFKFISVPYHPNVSKEGRICLNYLDSAYSPSLNMINLIECIRLLMSSPNFDDPVETDIARLYLTNEEKYHQIASEWARNNAKDSVEEWFDILEEK